MSFWHAVWQSFCLYYPSHWLKFTHISFWNSELNKNMKRHRKTIYIDSDKNFLLNNFQIIYMYRNPRDTALSFLNFERILHNYTGELDQFAEVFLQGLAPMYQPYFPHVMAYWNRRHQENILVLSFEEMLLDTTATVKKIGTMINFFCPRFMFL